MGAALGSLEHTRLRPQSSQQPLQPTAWLANNRAGQQQGWPAVYLASSTSGLCSVGPACRCLQTPIPSLSGPPMSAAEPCSIWQKAHSSPAQQRFASSTAQLQPSFSPVSAQLQPGFSPTAAQRKSQSQPRSNLLVSHTHTQPGAVLHRLACYHPRAILQLVPSSMTASLRA